MAIKIIKSGQSVFTEVCPRCRCYFSYELSDLTERELTEYCSYEYVSCPECGGEVEHDPKLTIDAETHPYEKLLHPCFDEV